MSIFNVFLIYICCYSSYNEMQWISLSAVLQHGKFLWMYGRENAHMKRLSALIAFILIVTILLGANTVGVFHYRDGALICETRKDSILNLNIKYNTLLNMLQHNLNRYLLTNDDRFQTEFYCLLHDYREGGSVSLDFNSFSEKQVVHQLERSDPNSIFDLDAQVNYLDLNPTEQQMYAGFLKVYNSILADLERAMEQKNQKLLFKEEISDRFADQHNRIVELMHRYISRLNQQEDKMLKGQGILEFTMIFTSVLMVLLAWICFRLLAQENRVNFYFRSLYTTVVENISAGIAILDRDGHFEYVNPEYTSIMEFASPPTGFTPRELLGSAVAEAINIKNDSVRVREFGESCFKINGNEKHIKYAHFTILDEGGSHKYVDLIDDTTETQVMQKKLRDQMEEIQYYSGVKDSFIANISHEIKTPINAILGMSHFLKNTDLTEKQKDLVNKIENSSDVLLSIINDVLDISKMKSRKMVLYPVEFQLMEAVYTVRDMFHAQMQEKGLEWRENIMIDPDCSVCLDRTRFIQILVNLVGNAFKFTSRGSIGISIRKISEDNKRIYLQFRIEDTGIGIDPQDIHRLFHEFEQLENHLSKQQMGTGLGLAICSHIVQAMGGYIWVKSEKDEGSRFYFTIPAPKALSQSDLQIPASRRNLRPDGRGARILVVEDTEINAEVVENLLEEVGIPCDKAIDGLEAVNICRTHDRDYYHLILMDIHMPRMNGYEASRALKEELKMETPILALTATSLDNKVIEENREIIDGFILKPIKAEAFYAALCDYFPAVEVDSEEDQPSVTLVNPSKSDISDALAKPANSGIAAPGISDTLAKPANADIPDTLANPGIPDILNISDISEEEEDNDPFSLRIEAVHNLGGKEELYRKHVEKFQAKYGGSGKEIEQALISKEYEEARRIAHSVKGLAGTLGMGKLQKRAAQLEIKIAEEAYQAASSALELYEKALQEVISTPLPYK